ncbi:hypothetical protein KPH14_010367 [Odynerus spinipes]|uniref:Uncharacterized protein n=1 Tax=Odynerus spinipes TaxID=1348599 RepID=A0AAD9RUN3_9HYME|nr:hypothetical protein KPH14_010367 [Odynerus spinipes]
MKEIHDGRTGIVKLNEVASMTTEKTAHRNARSWAVNPNDGTFISTKVSTWPGPGVIHIDCKMYEELLAKPGEHVSRIQIYNSILKKVYGLIGNALMDYKESEREVASGGVGGLREQGVDVEENDVEDEEDDADDDIAAAPVPSAPATFPGCSRLRTYYT